MFSETNISKTIQIGILVTLLKSQNMKNILIYLNVNLFLYTPYELLQTYFIHQTHDLYSFSSSYKTMGHIGHGTKIHLTPDLHPFSPSYSTMGHRTWNQIHLTQDLHPFSSTFSTMEHRTRKQIHLTPRLSFFLFQLQYYETVDPFFVQPVFVLLFSFNPFRPNLT